MSKQPEALRLADELENGHCFESQPQVVYGWITGDPTSDAATELRRLHALCQEMGEALERSDKELGASAGYHRDGPTRSANAAALTKWKESK